MNAAKQWDLFLNFRNIGSKNIDEIEGKVIGKVFQFYF
jgi:hypothetical protein